MIDFIRLNFNLYPKSINESYIYALSARIWNNDADSTLFYLETLLEIAYKYPLLVCKCQILPDLLKYIIYSCPENDLLIEIIITIICRALSFSSCREFVNVNDIFWYLIVPSIDHHYLYALLCNDEPLDDKEKNVFKIDSVKIKKIIQALFVFQEILILFYHVLISIKIIQ